MKEVIIEYTLKEHIEDILTFENLCFSIPWSKESFFYEINENNYARYFSAICEGRVIGYAGVWFVLDEAQIMNIAVHPKMRMKGAGSRLLEELINVSNREKLKTMFLEVRENNQKAINLYFKYGFTSVGVRKEYYADNKENAIIMCKNLLF